jgi:predicted aspartyl protease
MSRARKLIACAAFALLCAAPAARAQPPVGDLAAAPSEAETAIGAAISETGRMTVAVTIGDAGPYPFIVDTAAERTVIARDLAQELGLAQAGRARLLSMTSVRDARRVVAPNLSYGAGRADTIHAFALDRQHIGAAGVLGIDALRGQRVVLDFVAREVRVGPAPPRRARIDPEEIVVVGRTRYGQLVLADADVAGAPVDVVVDSGLSVSVGNDALRRLLVTRANRFEPIELVSITGETLAADYTSVDDLRIGGFAVRGMPVAFANAFFFRRMRLTRRPALLLGMDVLRLFDRVVVDFPNRRAHFVLPERLARPQS